MLFFTPLPIPPRQPAKIAVYMTGGGPLRLWAEGPGSTRIKPEEITAHVGSNWNRPGEEWGTYWRFPRTGCWLLRAERDGVAGTVNLRVAA
jgi:hypothetical protein